MIPKSLFATFTYSAGWPATRRPSDQTLTYTATPPIGSQAGWVGTEEATGNPNQTMQPIFYCGPTAATYGMLLIMRISGVPTGTEGFSDGGGVTTCHPFVAISSQSSGGGSMSWVVM